MDWDWTAVEAVAEIVGLMLVVISLLFVAYQVRQNTEQLRNDNLLRIVRGTLDTNWYCHRDREAFRNFKSGCASFEGLSGEDRAHFHSVLMDLSFYLVIVIRMHHLGLVDRSPVEVNSRFFLAVLDTPGGKEWWQFVKSTRPMPDESIEAIQRMIDDPGREPDPITRLQPWFGETDSVQSSR